MAEFNIRKAILQYRNPDILLDELAALDSSSQEGDTDINDEKSNNIQKKYTGLAQPLIKINSTTITGLTYFKLDLTAFKPTIVFRFNTIDERFIYSSYPKDGDIVSIYIRPLGNLFKPIRMDFIVNEVVSPYSKGKTYLSDEGREGGRFQTYTIFAEIRIPKLYKHISKSFKGTSYEALLKIAEDLGLGFASNEAKTNDKMNWIAPNVDYETLIKQIVSASWLDEEDYFDCWIDQYYNINMVNLKKQFDEKNSTLDTIRMAYGADIYPDLFGGIDTKEVEFPVMLTNSLQYQSSPLFIKAISLENNTGQISSDLGYFQKLQFYDDKLKSDKPKNKYVEYNIEAITNKIIGSRSVMNKGRIGEDIYKDEVKNTYTGTLYLDNIHENFHHAQIQNIINKDDSYKMILKVKNRQWTPFIYRGQNFPVQIVHESSTTSQADAKNTVESGPGTSLVDPEGTKTPNAFLSGNYVVLGFNIEYDLRDGMHQTVLLGKKEWTMNPGIGSDPILGGLFGGDIDWNELASKASKVAGKSKNDIFG
jgi:hypothetical protein